MKLNFISKGYFKSIQQFIFIKQIGLGSFGKVLLAIHVSTNRFYAIKTMELSKQHIDQKQIMLLQRQIYLHSEVDHPHIIKLWDTIVNENKIHLIMQMAQNGSLFSYQSKKKTFKEAEAFKFFSQTLKAIQYLHGLNIMHRDIKPENILLDHNYNIKICDLGWATEEINQKRKTFCGTYEYMAPQMVLQKDYTYKIDIWALGILLFQMLHGYAPFRAKSLEDIKQKFLKGFYQINSIYPKDLKSLIIDLLQFDPLKRPELDQIQKSEWVQRMKNQIYREGLQLKCQFQKKNQRKQNRKSQIKKQKLIIVETKKHKRIQSSITNQKFKQRQQKETKANDFVQRDLFEIEQNQNKKMKKKCKTQGEEQSLQKYQSQVIKPSLKDKFLNITNLSLKKKSQKQVLQNYKTHAVKWSNFPEFTLSLNNKYENLRFQNGGKHQNTSMTKIKKISDKIQQISHKIQKGDKKKNRLKTHNFF